MCCAERCSVTSGVLIVAAVPLQNTKQVLTGCGWLLRMAKHFTEKSSRQFHAAHFLPFLYILQAGEDAVRKGQQAGMCKGQLPGHYRPIEALSRDSL